MAKLMIIGAGVYQEPLITRAKELGHQVVIVAPTISKDLISYVDKFHALDVRDEQAALEIAECEKIEGVLTDQTDIAVRTVAFVAERMGLSGIGYDTSVLFTDKNRMREKCIELNIPTLPHQLVNSLEEASIFFDSFPGDAIIKPLDNQGSRGVQLVSSQRELQQKFKETQSYSSRGNAVIEKYATGREFVIEAASLHSEYRPLICGDTHYFDIPDAFAASSRIFPSEAPNDLVSRALKLNEAIIRGFGLSQGISHSEYVMDGAEIYLIETAARGGGVFISSDLIKYGSGLQAEDFLIDVALGKAKAIPQTSALANVCGYLAFFLPPGQIIEVSGIAKIEEMPWIHSSLLRQIRVGDEIRFKYDKTSRYALTLTANSHEELRGRIDFVKQNLDIRIKASSGAISGIIWD